MLTQFSVNRRLLTSRMLTVGIIGSVVLVNSVAWGIPLLVGADNNQMPSAIGQGEVVSSVTTGALPKSMVDRSARHSRPQANRSRQSRRVGKVPLPTRAPAPPVEAMASAGPIHVTPSLSATPAAAKASLDVARAESDLRRLERLKQQTAPPATLFPRPETAPALAKPASQISSIRPGDTRSNDNPPIAEVHGVKPTRDVVLVSPYTPGVRVAPNGRGHEWRHRNLRAASGPTTLDTAKAIARRAAERFEKMRDRMAKLDARDAVLSEREQAHRRALLPVAPRPPRIVDNLGRSIAKNATSFVRPRLVRRPIGQAIVPPPQAAPKYVAPRYVAVSRSAERIRPIAAKPKRRTETLSPVSNRKSRVRRVARVERAVPDYSAIRARRVRRANLRQALRTEARLRRNREARRNRQVRREREAQRSRRRAALRARLRRSRIRVRRFRVARVRQPRRRSYRSRRRIDGFRASFHRQLVSSNFFHSSD